jgi:cytochrome oxidase assembly protein ShyY1
MPINFRFRPIPFVATVLLVALGISLGNWQERRAAEKTALQHKLDERAAQEPLLIGAAPAPANALEYRHVKVTGQFVPAYPVYLNNRPQDGRAGMVVLMPFRIAESDMHVLVARGWLPRNAAKINEIAPYQTPSGPVTIEGIAKASVGHIMQLGAPEPLKPGAIVQNIDPAQFAKASGMKLQPFFIEQSGPGADGLLRNWPAPSTGVDKHQGYAFQWYALAVMALLFFVITGFRRGTNQTK